MKILKISIIIVFIMISNIYSFSLMNEKLFDIFLERFGLEKANEILEIKGADTLYTGYDHLYHIYQNWYDNLFYMNLIYLDLEESEIDVNEDHKGVIACMIIEHAIECLYRDYKLANLFVGIKHSHQFNHQAVMLRDSIEGMFTYLEGWEDEIRIKYGLRRIIRKR